MLAKRRPRCHPARSMSEQPKSDAKRLEQLWGGAFGDAYVDRNQAVVDHRGPFWQQITAEFPVRRVLEVGCNIGANLRWLAQLLRPSDVFGIDVNDKALTQLRTALPTVNAISSVARDLPFRDGWFDLVFT